MKFVNDLIMVELTYEKRKSPSVNPSQFIYSTVGDASAVRKYNEKDLQGFYGHSFQLTPVRS